jgi:tetratricopeptide (TPR) repeat protein
MGFGSYLLLWLLLTCVFGRPWLWLGAFMLMGTAQRFLPAPSALFSLLRHARRLRAAIQINPADLRARRDLARIYLDVMRPRAALALLEAALVRAPNDAELLYLSGLALTRCGRHEEALSRLVGAVEIDARIGFGQPYLAAGHALYALGRWDAAMDAYERYLGSNSSDVAAHTRLARAHARAGEREAAKKVLEDARTAFHSLRGRKKLRALGSFFKLQWTRVTLLKDPRPILQALLALAPLVALVMLGRACIDRAPSSVSQLIFESVAGDAITAMQEQIIPMAAPLDAKDVAAAKAEFVMVPAAYGVGTSQKFRRAAFAGEENFNPAENALDESEVAGVRGPGDFLGRLCSLFGPPPGDFPGIDYTILHKATGLVFTAYSADLGPVYGGAFRYHGALPPPPERRSELLTAFGDDKALRKVVLRFEALLASVPLADCSVVQDTDVGLMRFGAVGGKPIERQLSFAESIDFYLVVLDKSGPESDAPLYNLPSPRGALLVEWAEATAEERAQRPAALEHVRDAWRGELKALEQSATMRPVDKTQWSARWQQLNSSAPSLELPAAELEHLMRLRQPPRSP